MVTINGKEYDALLFSSKDTVTVDFAHLTILECAELGDKPQFEDASLNDVAYIKSMYIAEDNKHLLCTWARQADVEVLQEELQEAQQEIRDRDFIIDRIRQSIKDLGTGIPTLNKLMSFLSAVKEALNYD